MPATATGEASRLSSALTGISLAVGVAREATDAVPIVKQCLGAAVRIVAFAEKMEKDREELRELSNKSLQLAIRVKDAMSRRTTDSTLDTSLGRILRALESIETFMAKHSARSRLRRAIGYAFTVPQHVARLSRELAGAVQELLVVGLLDVDHRVHATHRTVEDDARFVGEFHLLRHCEVQMLEPTPGQERSSEYSTGVVRYHRARVHGDVYVVRYFEGSVPPQSSAVQTQNDVMYGYITYQDKILELLSCVQLRHRNVARIYGWSKGSIHDRFTVFKSGFHSVYDVVLPNPIATIMHNAFKLLDAVHHLERLGVYWDPTDPPYRLDDHLVPTIGLEEDDLGLMSPKITAQFLIYMQVYWLTIPFLLYPGEQDVATAELRAAIAGCRSERLDNLLAGLETAVRQRRVLLKDEFLRTKPLDEEIAKGILREVEDNVLYALPEWHTVIWAWANILLTLDKNRIHRLKTGLHAVYDEGQRRVYMHCLDEDGERIVYDRYHLTIPATRRDLREILGIPENIGKKIPTCRLVATGGPGTYRAPE